MTDREMAALLVEAEGFLKLTTQGYLAHSPSYWTNKTTNWYKALSRIETVIAELKFSLTLSGTSQVGKVLTAQVVVS